MNLLKSLRKFQFKPPGSESAGCGRTPPEAEGPLGKAKKWSVWQLQEEIHKIKQKEKCAKPLAAKKLVPQRGKVGVCRIVEWDGHEVSDLGFLVFRVGMCTNRFRWC